MTQVINFVITKRGNTTNYIISKKDNNCYINNNLITIKTRDQFSNDEEQQLIECYDIVDQYYVFVMALCFCLWEIDDLSDQFDPIEHDIIAYLLNLLIHNPTKINNNAIINLKNGKLSCNDKIIYLPSTGSDYSEWSAPNELAELFD